MDDMSVAETALPDAPGRVAEQFQKFKEDYQAKPLSEDRVANEDQRKDMAGDEDLKQWVEGTAETTDDAPSDEIEVTAEQDAEKYLWVLEAEVPVYAPENCAFGKTLQSGVIKHSNLTGGRPAHCGGELILLDDATIILNGQSGRYGPKSGQEMSDIAKAFRSSGYNVWSMGFDDEAGRPFPFVGVTPVWVL